MARMTLLRVTPDKTIDFAVVECPNVSVMLTLENVSTGPVAYKIKTTAPRNYLVRPSTGILQSGEVRDIQLTLQQPTDDTVNKRDRFLILAIPVNPLMQTLPKEFWNDVPRDEIQDLRLNVVYRLPNGHAPAAPSSRLSAASGPTAPEVLTHVAGSAAAAALTPKDVAPNAPLLSHQTTEPRIVARVNSSNTSSFTAAPGGSAPLSDNEAKYNELLQYCLAVESQKKALAAELEASTQQAKQLARRLTDDVFCKACGARVVSSDHEILGQEDGRAAKRDYGTAIPSTAQQPSAPATFQTWQVISIVLVAVLLLKFFSFL